MMKKLTFFAALMMMSGLAGAGTIAPSDTPTAQDVDNVACGMVSSQSPFKVTASKNVGLAYTCNTTAIAVNGGNTKGKYTYGGGTSASGGVVPCGGTSPQAVDTGTGYTVAAPDPTKDGCS